MKMMTEGVLPSNSPAVLTAGVKAVHARLALDA